MSDSCQESAEEWVRLTLRRYEAPLVRYATHITGDLERARDVVQDTFLKLCREDRRKVESHLAEWLFRVCRNRALDVRRKEDRLESKPQADLEMYPAEEPTPAMLAERKDTAVHALALLKRLPKNQQEVVRLKLQEGFQYQEISRITGLSVSNVGFLLHVALKTIRRELNALSSYENRT
jgi:RNA polymerase sigma factor (sigma-70 family)